MFSLRTRFCKFRFRLQSAVQWSSSDSVVNYPELLFQPKLSNSEQEKILNILNGSSSDRLLCLNIAQSKIKSLENYRKRKGPFKSLDELLEVDGLSVKMLEKLCKQIIADTPSQSAKPVNNDHKKIKQMIVPQVSSAVTDTLCSAVGIHVAPAGASWAKLVESGNELESWGRQDFGNLPKKLSPTDTFNLAMDILSQVPSGDAYIFEGTNSMGLPGQKPSTSAAYTLQLELTSMLLALINTSKKHNRECQDGSAVTNCVYFLRAKLAARLFKTLVGNECVSNTETVLGLLGDSPNELPCNPIKVHQQLTNDYLTQCSANRELLGQALMLTIAFVDICVRKHPISIKAVLPGKK